MSAWVYWQLGTSMTDSVGGYVIQVWGDAPVSLTTDHPLFKWQRREVAQPSPLLPQHFSLRHIANAQVLPIAINPNTQTSVTVELTSTAPRIGSRAVARIPHSPTQSVLVSLAFDTNYSNPPGWSRWRGTATIPGSAPDNRYIVNACVLDHLATGDCSTPAGLVLSEVAAAEYFIDRIAPALGSTVPGRFDDVFDVPVISVIVNEDAPGVRGSGLDPEATVFFVDEVRQNATVSGTTISATPEVAPGVHVVRAVAVDRAGNAATHIFVFTRVTLSVSDGTATLREVTLPVTGPEVRFGQPVVDISETTATINASTRVGWDTVSRAFTFDGLQIEFRRPDGATADVTFPARSGSMTRRVGVLTPSPDSMIAVLEARASGIDDVVVSTPPGFLVEGARATLRAATAALASVSPQSRLMDEGSWTGLVPVVGSIGACMVGDADEPASACYVAPRAGVEVPPAPGVTSVFTRVAQRPDTTDDGSVEQNCVPGGGGCVQPGYLRKAQTSIAFDCPGYYPPNSQNPTNLCSGLPNQPGQDPAWHAYLNPWLYNVRVGTRNVFPLWQQNHAMAGETAMCPMGQGGTLRGRTYRLVSNTLNSLSALPDEQYPFIGGVSDPATGFGYVYIGERTGNSSAGSTPTSLPFQLSNDPSLPNGKAGRGVLLRRPSSGTFLAPRSGLHVLGDGQVVELGQATSNGWEFAALPLSPGEGTTDRVQVMTGSVFAPDSVGLNAYRVVASLDFQLVLDYSAC